MAPAGHATDSRPPATRRSSWQDAPMPLTSPSMHELAAAGKRARKAVGRSALGPWDPDARQRDALEIVREQDESRIQQLVPIRHARMAFAAWTYYRGAAAVMAADLAATP